MSGNFPKETLVVVADGTQATLYRNLSNNGDLQLEKSGTLSPQNLKDDGPAGSRPPESTPQETDEATFAKQLAEYLNSQAQQKKYSAVLILGRQSRNSGSDQTQPASHVKASLLREVNRTLTHLTVSDIERSIG